MQDHVDEVRLRERASVRLDSTLAGSAAVFGALALGTLDGQYPAVAFFLPSLAFVVIAAAQHLRQRDRGFARVRRFYVGAAVLAAVPFVPLGVVALSMLSPFGVLAVSVAISAVAERSRYAGVAAAALVLTALVSLPGLFSKIAGFPYDVADLVLGICALLVAATAAVLAWRTETRALAR